jgi:hypothetical protein
MSGSWEVGVYSSMVQSIGYNPETTDLIVTWTNGKRSAYHGVPEALAAELSKAPSVGTMINAEIKPVYPHRYI